MRMFYISKRNIPTLFIHTYVICSLYDTHLDADKIFSARFAIRDGIRKIY